MKPTLTLLALVAAFLCMSFGFHEKVDPTAIRSHWGEHYVGPGTPLSGHPDVLTYTFEVDTDGVTGHDTVGGAMRVFITDVFLSIRSPGEWGYSGTSRSWDIVDADGTFIAARSNPPTTVPPPPSTDLAYGQVVRHETYGGDGILLPETTAPGGLTVRVGALTAPLPPGAEIVCRVQGYVMGKL